LHFVAGDEGSDSILDRETWSWDTGKKVINAYGLAICPGGDRVAAEVRLGI
jgi:hypothetical protein